MKINAAGDLLASPATTATSGSSAATSTGAENFAAEVDIITATNATILKKREQFAKQQAMETERIREVGMEQYIREQREVKKLMKILQLMKTKTTGAIKQQIDKVVDHFEQNPPKTVTEVYQYMESIIASLPKGMLRDQMQELLQQIQELMKEQSGDTAGSVEKALKKVLG